MGLAPTGTIIDPTKNSIDGTYSIRGSGLPVEPLVNPGMAMPSAPTPMPSGKSIVSPGLIPTTPATPSPVTTPDIPAAPTPVAMPNSSHSDQLASQYSGYGFTPVDHDPFQQNNASGAGLYGN